MSKKVQLSILQEQDAMSLVAVIATKHAHLVNRELLKALAALIAAGTNEMRHTARLARSAGSGFDRTPEWFESAADLGAALHRELVAAHCRRKDVTDDGPF